MTDSAATVAVVYALPDEQIIVTVEFSPGLNAAAAVRQSGLIDRFPELGGQELVLGIWGVGVDADRTLLPGDRVEISRPLVADPRDMRRELLQGGRVMGGAEAPADRIRTKG